MASKISINLDTAKENYFVCKCKQNDDLLLEANIFENGLALDLANKTITIQALKADGTYIIQNTDITKTSNKINAELVRDFSRVPGTTKIEVVLIESGKQNTTFSFYLEVVNSVIKGAVQSGDTVTILEKLQDKIVEAGAVKEETEQLIENGGAATTGQVKEITASLEQNIQESENFKKQKQYEKNAMLPLNITTYEGSGQTTHPSVLFFKDRFAGYKYWMAHTPYPYNNDDYENPCIVASVDGVNWVTPTGIANPIDIPTQEQIANKYHMSDTELVFANGRLECWYRLNVNGGLDQILRKTSTDGVTWSEREVVLDKDTCGFYCLSPSLIYEDGKYKFWFVGTNYEIYYIESVTGNNGTWTTPVVVTRNYATSPVTSDMKPWHMDIIKDFDGKYKVVFVTIQDANKQRFIYLGESADGLVINNIHKILSPTITGWDNFELYRPNIVAITPKQYRMYYGGVSVDNVWKIGVIEGENLDLLNNIGFNFDIQGAMFAPKVKLGEIGLLSEDEFILGIKGVKSVKVRNTARDELSVLKENGVNDATLKVKNSVTSKNTTALTESTHTKTDSIRPLNTQGLTQYGTLTLLGLDGTGKPVHKLLNTGVNDGCITLGDSSHTIRVAKTSDLSPAFLETSAILFAQGVAVGNVEGAIRYNFTTKKHQGYNGTTWNDLY